MIITVVSVSLVAICALLVVVYLQKRKLYRSYNELFEFNRSRMEDPPVREVPDAAAVNQTDLPADFREGEGKPSADVRRDPLAARISEIIATSPCVLNQDFSLPRFAELAGSNQKYVSQMINDLYGRGFTDVVNERRVDEAKRLLMDPAECASLTLEAIGEKVGFGSQSTFIRAFRKFTGLTPSIYRKIALQKQRTLVNS